MSNLIILHTADLHLGESKHILPDSYLERQLKMLYIIKDYVIEHKVDLLILAGDTFDAAQPAQDVKDSFLKWLVEIDSLSCKVLMIKGNHEHVDAQKTALDTIYNLRSKWKNIHLYLKPGVFNLKGHSFACIPWGYDLIKYTKKLNKKYENYYVVGHLPLGGLKTDGGFVIEGSHKKLLALPVKAFFLGDIHKRYISSCNRIQMAGSPIQHIWSDKLPKGISLLTTKNLKPKLLEIDVPKFEVQKDLKKAKKSKNIVKFVGKISEDEIENTNIVDTVNYLDEQEAIDYVSEFNVMDGLPDFMAEQGLTPKQQKSGARLVEKICRKI